jgi:hypothetical protein
LLDDALPELLEGLVRLLFLHDLNCSKLRDRDALLPELVREALHGVSQA